MELPKIMMRSHMPYIQAVNSPHKGLGGPSKYGLIWLWVYYDKIPIYPIFYLLKGDYRCRVSASGFVASGRLWVKAANEQRFNLLEGIYIPVIKGP